jgi:hypothetical protein
MKSTSFIIILYSLAVNEGQHVPIGFESSRVESTVHGQNMSRNNYETDRLPSDRTTSLNSIPTIPGTLQGDQLGDETYDDTEINNSIEVDDLTDNISVSTRTYADLGFLCLLTFSNAASYLHATSR